MTDTLDYITLGLASWGAIVSTGVAARQFILDRPRLDCKSEFEVRKVGSNPLSHAYISRARISNRGQRGVTIDEVGWHDDDAGRWTWTTDRPFYDAAWPPGEVKPGETLTVEINRAVDQRPNLSRLGVKAGGRRCTFPVDTTPGHEDKIS
jgi:hypothetical protein